MAEKSTIVKPPRREKTRKGKSKWRDFESRHSFSVISKPKHIPKNIPKENFNCQFCTILEPQEEYLRYKRKTEMHKDESVP